MANINPNNISISLLEDDIINNGIKELYNNSSTYNNVHLLNNSSITSLANQINNDIDSLNNSLLKFNLYLKNYINDYLSINSYLTSDSLNHINSIPTQNILKEKLKVTSLRLDSFNVPKYNLSIDYEIEFDVINEESDSNNNK